MKTRKETDPAEWEIEALIEALGALDDKARTERFVGAGPPSYG